MTDDKGKEYGHADLTLAREKVDRKFGNEMPRTYDEVKELASQLLFEEIRSRKAEREKFYDKAKTMQAIIESTIAALHQKYGVQDISQGRPILSMLEEAFGNVNKNTTNEVHNHIHHHWHVPGVVHQVGDTIEALLGEGAEENWVESRIVGIDGNGNVNDEALAKIIKEANERGKTKGD